MTSNFYEERRADRAAERTQDREDKRLEREERRKDRAAAEEARRAAQQEAQEAADRDRAARQARRAELRRKAVSEGDTIAALVVMACSIVPAVYYQINALSAVPGLPGPIAVALAVMLEAGAWVATIAGERAKHEGRPVGRFRAAMWGCAGLAAVVNFAHAPVTPFHWLAVVLAAASLGGVGFWELRGLGRHGGKAGRTREQRRQDRDRRAHERKRRAMTTVWARYQEILTAHPFGTVDAEAAWRAAWYDVHGADLAVTADSTRTRLAAVAALDDVLDDAERTPERLAVDNLLADLFGTGRGDDGPTAGGSGRPPFGGPDGTFGGGAQAAAPTGAGSKKAQVESQMPRSAKGTSDGRRSNGGKPPKRTAGDTRRYSAPARRAMSEAARKRRDGQE